MPAEPGILGIFSDPSDAARAIRMLRESGATDVCASMPAAFPEISEALGKGRSPIGRLTLIGAVVGVAAGFALCIATSLSWPLVTGGKPIASIPPFVVIAFELSVLTGALVNLIALAVSSRRSRRRRSVPPDPRFSIDRIGVLVVGGDAPAAERILQATGAEEVRHVE